MNALTLRSIPEIVRHLGVTTLAEADAEYWRRVDAFRDTDAACRLWNHWERVKSIATGLSSAEAEALDEAYWIDRDNRTDHAAIERAERARLHEASVRPQICGACGADFPNLYELIAHDHSCSFRQARISAESLIVER